MISNTFSQESVQQSQSDKFYFDAVVFRGDSINKYRIDNYFVIPYENINFTFADGTYIAKYTLKINVKNSQGEIVVSEKLERAISEKDYFVAQGGNADFDKSIIKVYLGQGNYLIEAIIIDEMSKLEQIKQREINVIDFNNFNFSLSGLLLLSSVEESNGKYKITPHISDNIGNLTNGFFIFFETYNKEIKYDSIDYVWEVYNTKDELIAYSDRIRKPNNKQVNRNFLRIPPIKEMSTGSYKVSLIALQPIDIKEYTQESALAKTNRSISYIRTVAGNVMADLNLAIRQMRYITTRDEMELIQTAPDESEKQKRFEEFWKKIDPTPYSDRNEAFDDYYSKINFANQKFKAFQEGWLSDMGMVYVIFGSPASQERQSGYGDGKIYERWLYGNSREFIFVDNTGFGDFRLVRPVTITEKYKYNR